MFSLPKTVNDIVTESVNRHEYDQITATREVNEQNFSKGSIRFKWSVAGNKWWIPNQSYLRTRIELSRANGDPLLVEDGVAPSMNFMSSLFQNAEFRINNTTVCRVSDRVAQVDTMEHRLHKSKSWLDSVGTSTNFWQYELEDRVNEVSTDGVSDSATSLVTLTKPQIYAAGNIDDAAATIEVAPEANPAFATVTVDPGAASSKTLSQLVKTGDRLVINGVVAEIAAIQNPDRVFIKSLDGTAIPAVATENLQTGAVSLEIVLVSSEASRRVKAVEINWIPLCLSIFKTNKAMPACDLELILTPHPRDVYKKHAIEALTDKTAGADFELKIKNMYLYAAVVEAANVENLEYMIGLDNTRCQAESLQGKSFNTRSFNVSPSTKALTVAYQSKDAGSSNTYSTSKFKSDGNELKLSRFYLKYSGVKYPAGPDADPEYDEGDNTDNSTQRYVESQIYNGAYYDAGGAETIKEFHERGAYYHFKTPRAKGNVDTHASVAQSFDVATEDDAKNMNVLLFDHSRAVVGIKVANGMVAEVVVEDL